MSTNVSSLATGFAAGQAIQNVTKNVDTTVVAISMEERERMAGIERIDVTEFVDLAIADLEKIRKKLRPNFERKSRNFMEDDPDIIFVAEYMVEGELAGALLVWERYKDATHYEIYKRNIFSQDPTFERILFLDDASLKEEKNRLIVYIGDVLGFNDIDEENIYIFLDHRIKSDRIYEYKVKAVRVPRKAADIDFDLALESQNLLTSVTITRTNPSNMFQFAGAILGSEDLAWVISLLNEHVYFFGRRPAEKSLAFNMSAQGNSFKNAEALVNIPQNMSDLLNMISESVALFGIRETFGHITDVLGGLTKEFRCAFIDACDETRNVFSYDRFKTVVAAQLPVFQLLLNLSESESLLDRLSISQLSITLPTNTGSEVINSLDGLVKIFKFVNDVLLVVLYSQDKENFEKLKEIVDTIALSHSVEKDPVEEAADDVRNQEADAANTADETTTTVTVENVGSTATTPTSSNSSVLGVSDGSTSNTNYGGVLIRQN